MTDTIDLLEAHLLGEEDWIAAERLCRACDLSLEAMAELADLGAVTPRGYAPSQWQLPATVLPRLMTMARLMHDLGINASGAALAADLLDIQRHLEQRLRELERRLSFAG